MLRKTFNNYEKNSLCINHACLCCVCSSSGEGSRHIGRFLLQQSLRRELGRGRRLWIWLAARRSRERSELAPLFGRILGVHRLRMDLDQLRRFRLGGLSLRSLGESRRLRLDVVCGNGFGLGTSLGVVANRWRLHWLGAFATARSGRCL